MGKSKEPKKLKTIALAIASWVGLVIMVMAYLALGGIMIALPVKVFGWVMSL